MPPNSSEKIESMAFPVQVQPEELVESIRESLAEKQFKEEEISVEKPELHYEPY